MVQNTLLFWVMPAGCMLVTVKPAFSRAALALVLNAVAKHDTYVDNLYTHVEDVGGIIPSTAKVVSTVDNCTFDSINEIARACCRRCRSGPRKAHRPW